ncbi:hypothetical protein HY772_04200 [Candidatus Woesearchaeota archaeon]|nr:hypothetical protein [Candidatus Woesearchaeota archaeon]
MKIDSLSQFVTVVLGETLLVDLDRDAVNDVSILLSNVVNGKGTFVIKSLLVSQPVGMVSAPAPAAKKVVQPEMVSKEGVVPVQEVVPVAPSVSEVQPPVVSERELPVVEGEGVQKSKVSWVVGAVFAVLVILGGLAYYFTRRKP